MVERSDRKLNRLQRELPDDVIVDAAWLEGHGYPSNLRSHYVKAGWLSQVAPRVYRRSRGQLDWKQVAISLQSFLDRNLTIGGRTSLEEQGHAHYLRQGRRAVYIYGPDRPPSWLASLPVDADFKWRNSLRLFPNDPAFVPADKDPLGLGKSLVPGGFVAHAGGLSWPLRFATVERAFLELLDELPDHENFHDIDMMMEGLSNLSPNRLQTLLQSCRSVKVKRLFFFFADRHQHAWLKRIDRSKVDLGSGKRLLVRGGRLDTRYGITVPEEMHGAS